MKNQIRIVLLTVFILISCNENKENRKSEISIESKYKLEKVEKVGILNNDDYSENAEKFARTILREGLRKHSFDLSLKENPVHINIFITNSLEKVQAYSNKNYPKNIEPNYYEHFILFVATYKDKESAIKTYDQIKSYSKFGLGEHTNLEKGQSNGVLALNVGAKSGGMIVQKGKQVFSLVETCRDAPLNWTWEKYENTLLEFLDFENDEISVLNSDCGNDRYLEEKRKPARNNVSKISADSNTLESTGN